MTQVAQPLRTEFTIESQMAGEGTRFRSILRRHIESRGADRRLLRSVLVEYLRFSPQSQNLINDLIKNCVEMDIPERLDVAIDVLSQLGNCIYDYASKFLQDDLKNWHHLYPCRAYEPNDDYWYILLRSVARADVPASRKLLFISMCSEALSRGVLEGVVEALGDIDTADALACLQGFRKHGDPFIANLAEEILAQS